MHEDDKKKNRQRGRDLYNFILLSLWVLLVIGLLVWLPPGKTICRHCWYYPEAERIAKQLRHLNQNVEELNEEAVLEYIDTHASFLKTRIMSAALTPDEMIWIDVNQMFNVGLAADGQILWMIDGKRTTDGE